MSEAKPEILAVPASLTAGTLACRTPIELQEVPENFQIMKFDIPDEVGSEKLRLIVDQSAPVLEAVNDPPEAVPEFFDRHPVEALALSKTR